MIEEKTVKKDKKRQKKREKTKPRANSGMEIEKTSSCLQNRPRAATESQISMNTDKIKPLGELPSLSKDKPWGDKSQAVTEFKSLQELEGSQPLFIKKWENFSQDPVENFAIIQEAEKEDNEIDEALIMIAIMESKTGN